MKITKKFIKECIWVLLLGALLSLSYQVFILSNQFAPSGINGIATMIQYKFNFSVGYMSLIINIPLCIAAYFVCNKEYAIKSFLFVVVFSLTLLLWQETGVLDQFIYETHLSTLLAPIAGGVVMGFIMAMSIKLNASTGGTDIIAKLYTAKNPNSSLVHVIFLLNVVVAGISYFVYDYQLEPVILCIMYSFISSEVGDKMLKSSKRAVKFEIVTAHAEEISADIIANLHHSVTLMDAMGMYTRSELKMLVCIVNRHQVADLQNLLKKYPDTFGYITTVTDTVGNFKRVKSNQK